MFKNYFKATYRHLLKSKVNFLFKLGGLTLALLSFLIIAIYVSFQLSFDRFHEDYENIYRVNSNRDEGGNLEPYAMVPPPLGPAIKAEFPEVKSYTRLNESRQALIKYNDKLLRLEGFAEADSSIFDVFAFTFLKGNKKALNKPHSIVLTKSMARQIFGEADPINKLISFPDRSVDVLQVTGVIEDLPSNSHLTFKAIIASDSESISDSWKISWDGSTSLYIRLNDGAKPIKLEEKIKPLLKKRIPASEDGKEKRFSIFLQPIKEIYLGPELTMEFHKKGNPLYVAIFSLLGFFLLIIASVNYVNLSIADFSSRSKEIGVRKVLGARKKQIAFQITLEAILFCLSGLVLSIGILYFLFPSVAQLLEPDIVFGMLLDRKVIEIIAITLLFLVAFSTAYPTLQLSRNSPVNDLKKLGFGRSFSVGKKLLFLQFVISIICISATMIVGDQIKFIKTKDVGFDRSNVVTLVMPDNYPPEKVPILKNELSRLADVEAVSYSYYLITGGPYLKDWYKIEVGNQMKQILLNEVFIDHDFFRLMKVQLVAGRSFDLNNPADMHTAFIVNETAVQEFGWSDPLGKRISHGYGAGNTKTESGTVIGVVKNFNTLSLHKKIEPLVMRLQYDSWPGRCLNVKVSGSVKNALPKIKSTYEKIMPGFLVEYRLIEEVYDQQYQNENRTFTALQIGTWIIVVISALGIFSLSIYMSVRRMKEFGIRKVLGA